MTKTEIVNYALACIGQPRVQSLSEEDNPTAVKAAGLLPISIRHVLRVHEWPTQIKRQYLAAVALPATAWTAYAYALPPMVRALGLVSGLAYTIEGETLYTDDPEAMLRFVFEPGETIADELLAETIGLHLAARFAVDIVNNPEKQARLQGEFVRTLETARDMATDEGTSSDKLPAEWYQNDLRAD